LGLDRVGAEDDFLELGGDSLSATRVISRVMLEFHVRLPLRLLFEASTVARMAQIVAEHSAARSTGQRLVPIAAEPAAYPKR
jgi:aspartate racemase